MDSRNDDANRVPSIPSSARVGSQAQFRKVLSLQELLFISLGASIGSAWLFGSAYGAAEAGPASIVSWLIGGLFAIVIALAFFYWGAKSAFLTGELRGLIEQERVDKSLEVA